MSNPRAAMSVARRIEFEIDLKLVEGVNVEIALEWYSKFLTDPDY
jgi:hypothetical protein